MGTTLAVLAAGIGSRYGGLKQMDPVGPSGEFILDYSAYDALQAGFDRVVFVIRQDIEAAFREVIGDRIGRHVATDYVCQEMTDGVGDFPIPPGRTKPWGTAHAAFACRAAVREPFAVINADDLYGRETFQLLGAALRETADDPSRYCMAGFRMDRTTTEHGSVARGVCEIDAGGRLARVVEHTAIEQVDGGFRSGEHRFSGREVVSMNAWGLKPSIFAAMEEAFARFLATSGADPKAEFYLPTVVDELIAAGRVSVDVLATPCSWFGTTYAEDRARVVEAIAGLVADGVYPASLWD